MRLNNRAAYEKGFEFGVTYLERRKGTILHEFVKTLDSSTRDDAAAVLRGYTAAITRNGNNGHYPVVTEEQAAA